MPRMLIIAGTGAIGRATARRLLTAGWEVDLTGRDFTHMPADLTAAGATFAAVDRDAPDAAGRLLTVLGEGADLVVDCACYTADDARRLVSLARRATSTVMISSKAVYVDEAGNHPNSEVAPRFGGPIREDQPTLTAGSGDHTTREGYGANKVAAEQVLLDSGLPVSVLRLSKVHGAGARRPREWMFVKRALDYRTVLLLARGGAGVDHTTAAVNTAALIETVATRPGRRVLNSADPDAPNALEISRTIARLLDHTWREVLLDGAPNGDAANQDLGRHPWDARPPIVLDTSAAADLGYVPAGTYAESVAEEVAWLLAAVREGQDAQLLPGPDDSFFAPLLDYAAEDRYLATRRS